MDTGKALCSNVRYSLAWRLGTRALRSPSLGAATSVFKAASRGSLTACCRTRSPGQPISTFLYLDYQRHLRISSFTSRYFNVLARSSVGNSDAGTDNVGVGSTGDSDSYSGFEGFGAKASGPRHRGGPVLNGSGEDTEAESTGAPTSWSRRRGLAYARTGSRIGFQSAAVGLYQDQPSQDAINDNRQSATPSNELRLSGTFQDDEIATAGTEAAGRKPTGGADGDTCDEVVLVSKARQQQQQDQLQKVQETQPLRTQVAAFDWGSGEKGGLLARLARGKSRSTALRYSGRGASTTPSSTTSTTSAPTSTTSSSSSDGNSSPVDQVTMDDSRSGVASPGDDTRGVGQPENLVDQVTNARVGGATSMDQTIAALGTLPLRPLVAGLPSPALLPPPPAERPVAVDAATRGSVGDDGGVRSNSGDYSRSSGGGGGGGAGEERGSAIDPLVARLARVVAFVERELLGDPRGAAAATAVSIVHSDVPLPPPVPPAATVQPLELFAEAPMTGRLLARAGAAAEPQREVPSPPSEDEWKLLGGSAPSPSSVVPRIEAEPADSDVDIRSSTGSSRSSSTTVLFADELFHAREREQSRYRSYLRQFVLRSAQVVTSREKSARHDVRGAVGGDSGAEKGGGDARGVKDRSGVHQQHQKRRHQWEKSSLATPPQKAVMEGGIDSVSGERRGGGSGDVLVLAKTELRQALLDEITSASDWLQLRTLMDAAQETDQLNLSVVGALLGQTADLLSESQMRKRSESQLLTGPDVSSAGRVPGTSVGSTRGGGGSGEEYGSALSLTLAPPSVATFGPAEAKAYTVFCRRMTTAALAALLSRRQTTLMTTRSVGDGGSGRGVAQISYGMGMLQIGSRNLYDEVLWASSEIFSALTARQRATTAATAAAASVLNNGGGLRSRVQRGRSALADMAATAAASANAGGTPLAPVRQDRGRTGRMAPPPPLPPLLTEPCAPSDLASLAWGVATAYGGATAAKLQDNAAATAAMSTASPLSLPPPEKAWLRALCDASLETLVHAGPTEMWQLLWSLARMSYVPPEDWMRLFLERLRGSMSDFDSESLCRIAWALAALDYVPDRLWMRALVGQLHNRLRDLTPEQLVSLYGSLARLGYAPRPEVGSGLHARATRLMPLMSGEQLAALSYYAASFDRWRPGEAFLAALARAIRPHAAALTAPEASRLLWVWARSAPHLHQRSSSTHQHPHHQNQRQRFLLSSKGGVAAAAADWLPHQLAEPLMSRILVGMRSGTTDGNDLSMALWALAVLRRLPSAEWMAAWWRAAAEPRITATFDGTCVAQSLWAAAQLRTLAGPFEGASLYGLTGSSNDQGTVAVAAVAEAAVAALLGRMSGLLRSTDTANLSTTIAALADLQYRPSDALMTLFAAEARRRLSSETAVNEDHGLIAYGLAVLGWPLQEPWVKELAAGGYRRMAGMSGEALGLFLWGLSQYGWSTDSKRFWDTVFRETGAKWDSCSARSVVLLYCAVADLMPPKMEPPLQWQRQLTKALRLRVPRPPAAALIPAALRAAAGGCLGPSPLRLRGPAAIAAASPGGLHVRNTNAAAVRTRRSALEESLFSSLVYSANLYGDLGVRTEMDGFVETAEVKGRKGAGMETSTATVGMATAGAWGGGEEDFGEEEEVLGPEFPEEGMVGESDPWDGEAGWGGDPSVWTFAGDEVDGNDGAEEADVESDEDYYERVLREMYDDGDEEWNAVGAGGRAVGAADAGSAARQAVSVSGGGLNRQWDRLEAGQQQQPRQEQPSPPVSGSPYVFDQRMRGPDPVDPYSLLSGGIGGGTGSRRLETRAASLLDAMGTDGGNDDEPFQLPLPSELSDPRDHPALAAAVSELRVWWAHDVADELRWLWGFPGALRALPPWVRQPSLARLRKMTMRRR